MIQNDLVIIRKEVVIEIMFDIFYWIKHSKKKKKSFEVAIVNWMWMQQAGKGDKLEKPKVR